MDMEFRTMLKSTLEDFDKRLRMLEHSVNDVIIGSLESAATEYKDAEDYDNFKTAYGADIEGLVGPYKKMFGEDYDLERSLFDDLRATEGYGTEGFDEAGCMKARIEDLKARIDAIREEVKEVAEDAGKKDEPVAENKPLGEEALPDDAQLEKELKDALAEGASE